MGTRHAAIVRMLLGAGRSVRAPARCAARTARGTNMGHAHGHHHGHHGHSGSRPTKQVKGAVLAGLQASGNDPARALAAIEPLRFSSPGLWDQCRQLIESGGAQSALPLVEMAPTRPSAGVILAIVFGSLGAAGVIVLVVLLLTLR